MKKIILVIFGLMLIASEAFALTPDEITGKWASNKITETDPNGEGSMDVTFTLNFDGSQKAALTEGISANLDMGQGAKLFMYNELQADCEYTVEGDSITLKIIPESVKLNITEDDIRIIGIDDAATVEGMKQQMVAGLQQQLPMMAEQLASDPLVLNNVVVLPKKMTAMIDGKMVTFKRKK